VEPSTRLTSSAFCYHAITVAAAAISSKNIRDASIQFEDIAQNGATELQVMRWKGTAWVPAYAGDGDITRVTAGNGLTGGGEEGNVTLTVGEGEGINVSASTVSLDRTFTDGLYVKAAGDTMTGSLHVMNTSLDENLLTLGWDDPDDGGMIKVLKSDGAPGVEMYGGSKSAGATMHMYSADLFSIIKFDSDDTGDDAVWLPDSSVSSEEIQNEPGIAVSLGNNTLYSSMTTLDTITITIPAAGYIIVDARGGIFTTTPDEYISAAVQIDETEGGDFDPYYSTYGSSDSGIAHDAFYISRVYYKPAGTHSFLFEGLSSYTGSGLAWASVDNLMMTARYYPTAYGDVEVYVSPAAAAAFDQATPIAADNNNSSSRLRPADGYRVDLRELELKATRARLAAEQAERELLEAQMQQMRQSQNHYE